MSLTVEDLHNVLQQWFPMKSRDEKVSLEYVEVSWPDHPRLVVRLVIWDEHEGRQSIRDVKEQELWGGPIADSTLKRLVNYLEAMQQVMKDLTAEKAEVLMPHDLVIFTGLKLSTAHSVEDFVKALRAKSRLGKHL
ncbi:MAG: hypothetical protein QM831_36530 [Kofleriaceae bacterium]